MPKSFKVDAMKQRKLVIIIFIFLLLGCSSAGEGDVSIIPTLIPTAEFVAPAPAEVVEADTEIPMQQYEDATLGVRFMYPQFWERQKLGDNLIRVGLDDVSLEEQGLEGVPLMLVGVYSEATIGVEGVDFEDPVAVLEAYFDAGLAGEVLVDGEITAVSLNGNPAATVQYTQQTVGFADAEEDQFQPTEPLANQVHIVLVGEQIGLLISSTAEADREAFDPTFQQILDSVELFPPEEILN